MNMNEVLKHTHRHIYDEFMLTVAKINSDGGKSWQVLFEKSEDIGGVWRGSNYAGYGAQVKREQHPNRAGVCLIPRSQAV